MTQSVALIEHPTTTALLEHRPREVDESASMRQKALAKRRTARPRPPDYLSHSEMDDLIEVAPHERSRLFILVQWRAGLRISETLALEWRDFDFDAEDGPTIRVRRGKGHKVRLVPLHSELAISLRWARDYDPAARRGGRLFPVSRSQGSRWIQTAVRRWRELGGPARQRKKVSAHTMRHSFARHMLANAVPLNVVSNWLGHARLATTMRYLEILPDPARHMEGVP